SELWSEDFLIQWLTEKTEKKAVFVTYACTGSLKRALKKTGFNREEFAGFGGKRESTLAWRDL
ncbi:MAG: MnmC family methyltransferase, partial [Bdellovibrio sp.]